MYTEHVPVTSTGTFGGYQVIVMPSQDLPPTLEATKHIDDFNEPKFPIDPNEGQMNFSKLVVVNSFANFSEHFSNNFVGNLFSKHISYHF